MCFLEWLFISLKSSWGCLMNGVRFLFASYFIIKLYLWTDGCCEPFVFFSLSLFIERFIIALCMFKDWESD